MQIAKRCQANSLMVHLLKELPLVKILRIQDGSLLEWPLLAELH